MGKHGSATTLKRPVLCVLIGWLSPRRKRQFGLLFVLMLMGALAEFAAIGAVLPFLRLIVAPKVVLDDPRLDAIRTAFGWRTSADLLLAAALLLIACAVTAAMVRLLLTWASQRFIYRLGYDMDAELFRRTVRRPYIAAIGGSGSEILAGFDKINILANTLLLPMMGGIASAVIAFFIVALLIWVDPFTAIVTATATVLIYVGIAFVARASLGRASEERARLAVTRIKAVNEGLGGVRDIVLDRSHAFHERRFAAINNCYRRAAAHAAIVAATPRYVVEGAGVALIGVLAVYLAGRPGGVMAAVPTLGVLVLGAQRLLPLLQSTYQGVVQYLAARTSLVDVLDLMTAPIIDHAPSMIGEEPVPFRREITLAGVGFRYPGAAAAITDVDLAVVCGQRVGIVGRTGSGKSTLVDVIMGLLPPTQGEILLDGVPLAPDRVAAWQAQVAHVPQAVFLADDSVAANIAFGADDGAIDTARVEEAARRAQLHDDVVALPQGYTTSVGERGVRLSGGQRQRIGIARALYRRADLLVLDEATSALDGETEAAVTESVATLGRDITVIVIAHRLSTLRGCDIIYRLEGGRIVARGDHRLLKDDDR